MLEVEVRPTLGSSFLFFFFLLLILCCTSWSVT